MLQVAGAQPGLDMAEGDAAVEAGDGGGHDRAGIALRQHHGGRRGGQQRIDAIEDAGDQAREALVRPHQVEIVVAAQPEGGQRLVEQVASAVR